MDNPFAQTEVRLHVGGFMYWQVGEDLQLHEVSCPSNTYQAFVKDPLL